MAERELAILLKARNLASGPIKRVSGDLKGLDSVAGRAGKGVGTAILNLKRLGVGAAAGVAVGGLAAIKSGMESLAERENVVAGTTAAITAQGKSAKVTAGQVRNWSEELEAATGAAVDDKAIQAAATSLIRFGTIGEKEFKRTLAAATDLGAGMKTGPEAGAKLLGKALSDPIKGMTALRKAGIVLTAAEQKRIKQLVEGNRVQEAQGVILAAVEKRYKGAAAASAGPYTRALNLLADASEDAKMALAEGFLPILTKVSERLSKKLGDPKTIEEIRRVGQNLAGAFDKVLDASGKIPWGTIGDSMKLAGAGAKAAFDLFTGLPPWVQTAVITGWGLNKLSGGAVGGIIGELGKGLIKGVLGMNAGVVNLNAAVVNGGGGIPGVAGAAGGGLLATALPVAAIGLAIAAPVVAALKISSNNSAVASNVANTGKVWVQQSPSISELKSGLAAVDKGINEIQANPLNVLVSGDALEQLRGTRTEIQAAIARESARLQSASTRTKDDLTAVGRAQVAAQNATRDKVESAKIANTSAAAKIAAATAAVRDKVESARIATISTGQGIKGVVATAGIVAKAGGLAAASAINRKDLSVDVTVPVRTTVSVRAIMNGNLVVGQYQKTYAQQRSVS